MARQKPTISDVRKLKNTDYKITALTAYDFWQAKMADMAGIDAVVVNDIAYSCLECGLPNGRQTTVEDIVRATTNVKRGSGECLVIVSMPFGSYVTPEIGLVNAVEIYKATDCDALHIEGGRPEVIAEITKNGIPVLGHIGVTKVNIAAKGVTKLTGKTPQEAGELLAEAKALEEAGCFGIVLECMPTQVAKQITDSLGIVTVGIGAGIECNGQFLVTDDMLGLLPDFNPKFVKRYANVLDYIVDAFKRFGEEVRNKEYPSREYSYEIKNGGAAMFSMSEGMKSNELSLPIVPNDDAFGSVGADSYSNPASAGGGSYFDYKKLPRPSWADVNLNTIINNIKEFKGAVGPNVSVMVANKAHGYGHGLLPIARVLEKEDIWGFVTGNVLEAIEMRKAGIKKPIQLFANIFPENADLLMKYDLQPSFVNPGDAKAFSEALGRNAPLKVWVKVDTGLGRLGLFPEDLLSELRYIRDRTSFNIEGLYSHIGPVDATGFDKHQYNNMQIQLFDRIVRLVKEEGFNIPHYQIGATFASQAYRSSHFNTVCIGHGVFINAKPQRASDFNLNLRNCLEGLRSRLVSVKLLKKGTRTLNVLHEKDTLVGVVPFGVGDGFTTKNNGGDVLVNGKRCKIFGVCYEHTAIDLSNAVNPQVGDVVTFIGKDSGQEITLEECLNRTGMSVLEFVSSLSFASFPYIYWQNGKVVASGVYEDSL